MAQSTFVDLFWEKNVVERLTFVDLFWEKNIVERLTDLADKPKRTADISKHAHI